MITAMMRRLPCRLTLFFWSITEIARKVEQTGYLPLSSTVRPIEAAGIAGTSAGGINTLLALIMDNPEYWPHELVSRATSRLIYLEGEAERIYQMR